MGLFVGCAEAGSLGSVRTVTGAGVEPDSSTLIVELDELLGARASLFRSSVAGLVLDPCFENVRMDTPYGTVCNTATTDRPVMTMTTRRELV